jgi:hypothetical protein
VLTERGEPNAELFVFVYERTPCAGGSMCWACKHVLIFVVVLLQRVGGSLVSSLQRGLYSSMRHVCMSGESCWYSLFVE